MPPSAEEPGVAGGAGAHAHDDAGAWLKASIFATGLAGIVAEYVMATLASYLVGDAVRQWTLVISTMLFAMGLGSRLSRHLRRHLLDAFVAAEILLSLLVAGSGPATFAAAARIETVVPLIYGLAAAIGILIGAELPLATRLNERFEELRTNVSSVIEKDYYGALAGGLLFAFVALPYLGLTYTPMALGALNWAVAAALVWRLRALLVHRRLLILACCATPVALAVLAWVAEPIVLFGEQRRYRDRVVHVEQSPHQRIVLTEWRGDHWLYLDGNLQLSTVDEERYHEPLVHPALALAASPRRVLILGGGDGMALREALEHPRVESVTLVDLDPAMTGLARRHPALVAANRGSLDDPRVRLVHADALRFLESTEERWNVAIVDLPDPKTVSLARLYTRGFYELLAHRLGPGGVIVTQATSPFFAPRAFLTIWKTLREAGLVAVPYHAHVPTMGEWGWVIGLVPPARGAAPGEDELRRRLAGLDFASGDYGDVEMAFLNPGAMAAMLHFGKGFLAGVDDVRSSSYADLAVFYEYRDGSWDLY